VAGNHDLAGTVDVGGADDLTLCRLLARLRHDGELRTDDGGHGPHPHGHGLLHVSSSATHKSDRVAERERARCHVRGVFAEAVTGDVGGCDSFARQHSIRRNTGGENGRLGDLGELKILRGTFETESAQAGLKTRL
jgi:hypothetical protein